MRDQREYYNQVWDGGLARGKEQRGNLQTNLEFLEKTGILKEGEGQSILEIGCGIGTVVHTLTEEGYQAFGTDISDKAIRYGKEKYPNTRLEVQKAEKIEFEDNSFDIVLSFDLFEHIAEIDKHVGEVRRVLRPKGYYLFQTPNKYSNATFETLAKKSFKWREFHPSLHSPGGLKRRMSKHGFTTEFVKMNPINEFTLDKLRSKFGKLGEVFKHVNFTHLPLCLQPNMYVIARKTE